jgi:hypothetical protein
MTQKANNAQVNMEPVTNDAKTDGCPTRTALSGSQKHPATAHNNQRGSRFRCQKRRTTAPKGPVPHHK